MTSNETGKEGRLLFKMDSKKSFYHKFILYLMQKSDLAYLV